MSPTRRAFIETFLKGAGCFALPAGTFAGLSTLAGCTDGVPGRGSAGSGTGAGSDAGPGMDPGGTRPELCFPQGVASGDPTPDTVVLWTRAVPSGESPPPGTDGVDLLLEVALDPDFARIVGTRTVLVDETTDWTVRVIVHDLEPDTRYWYRFSGGGSTSMEGRTRTAPPADSDRPVKLAFVSCQSYEGGFYGAWRRLILDDEAASEEEQIDVVLHLGDYIYEALGYGAARRVEAFPSGGGSLGEEVDWASGYAVTLDDYRHLWKTYLADPDMMAARARWPFVVTWDDHEFSDDAWQGMATFTVPPEPAQERKVAANRAWFEFVPAFLTGHPGTAGVPSEARDFEMVEVVNAPLRDRDEHGFYREPNNLAAVNSMTIYRSFRWGRHAELVVTDTRSYRSEHPVPGELNTEISGSARYISPLPLVEILDAGREANGGSPPERIPLGEMEIPNPRREAPPGTMLGPAQKSWFKETLRRSDATWKLWGNSVPAMPMRLDLDQIDPAASPTVFTIDTWEGYPSERAELLRFLREEGIRNVISLAGDNHNNFAGLLQEGFGSTGSEGPVGSHSPGPIPAVATEFAVCGISSPSVFRGVASVVAPDDPFRALVVFDATRFGGNEREVEALNLTFLHGCAASVTLAETGDLALAMRRRNPFQNPHLRYVDSRANGYATIRVSGSEARAELVTVEEPLEDRGLEGARVLRRARFRVPLDDGRGPRPEARLEGPELDGVPPFPLSPAPGDRVEEASR